MRLVGGVHLVLVLLCSTETCLRNTALYREFPKLQRPAEWMRCVTELPVISGYTRIVGIHGGYGFYAPRVGSHFVAEFVLFDERGDTLAVVRQPFHGLEGRIRYRRFLDLFSTMLPGEGNGGGADELQWRIARATAVSMAQWMRRTNKAASVTCQVYVWRPAPSKIWRLRDARYIPIHTVHVNPNHQT